MIPRLFLLLLLFSSGLCSQESSDMQQLLQKGDSLVYINPTEAGTVASYVLENTQEPTNFTEAAYILTRAYFLQGRYDDALKIALDWEGKPEYHFGNAAIKLHLLIADVYLELGLYGLHADYSKKAQQLALKEGSVYTNLLQVEMLHDSATIHSSNGKRRKALLKLREAKKEVASKESIKDFKIMNNVNLDMARWHLHEYEMDSTRMYLEAAKKESDLYGAGNFLEFLTLLEYGHLFFHENDYVRSLDSLQKAKHFAHIFQDPKWLEQIYELEGANYLSLDQDSLFQKYGALANTTAREARLQSERAINTTYTFFNTNGAKALEKIQKKEQTQLYTLGGILLFALTVFGLLVFRYRSQLKQFRQFKKFLEKQDAKEKEVEELPAKTTKGLQIPEETEKAIIQKLSEFEASEEYTDQGISLAQLASNFNTNTKYLSEIINSVKGSNFNTYINELRVNYIIHKLRTDPLYRQYKVSYLAEESGFSSHSSFTTVFKSITGISPTAFIGLLQSNKKRKEASVEN